MNKVILMGNLTRDPELKFLQSGVPVANFGMAMNERWNDQQTGEQKESVCFVEVEAWNRQAEVINEYFTKGSQILMEGALKFESWEAPDGTNRNRLKVRLQRFEFVGSRSDNGNGNGNATDNSNPTGNGNATGSPETPAPAPTTDNQPITDDDIPF
ncbi:single-stranded DNA-binding protein [Candidatus Poribacteria bacterium]|nr:single-stranded DNA-binding protein [Candidatus Poribacteria bacterium]